MKLKEIVSSYASFTRRERAGLIALCSLLLLLLVFRVSMSLWVKTPPVQPVNGRLFNAYQVASRAADTTNESVEMKNSDDAPYELNINTVDSNDLSKFKGLSAKNISALLRHRVKAHGFHNLNEIKQLTSISDENFAELVKHFGPKKQPPATTRASNLRDTL